MQAIGTEQELAKQGMLQKGSGITGGQLVAADYTITPNVIFSNQNAGGIGAAAGMLGAVIPGAALPAIWNRATRPKVCPAVLASTAASATEQGSGGCSSPPTLPSR